MKNRSSGASRPPKIPVLAAQSLTQLSVRELLQRLAAYEEALRAAPPEPAARAPGAAPDRQTLLDDQDKITGELRRRRHLGSLNGVERPRSAAWPPPPW